MKIIGEYLADAVNFERLAETEQNEEVKAVLKGQAAAYRRLAIKRAKERGMHIPGVYDED